MSPFDYKPYYKRNLPHIQPPGATFFITFRLWGSLPTSVIQQLIDEEKRANENASRSHGNHLELEEKLHEQIFTRLDHYLHQTKQGPDHLSNPDVIDIVARTMRTEDHTLYELLAYCIMPNHVHLLIKPLPSSSGIEHSLASILQKLKGRTAFEVNQYLHSSGHFWQQESYDHFVRDAKELQRVVRYILNNPVTAGLTGSWRNWAGNYSVFPNPME